MYFKGIILIFCLIFKLLRHFKEQSFDFDFTINVNIIVSYQCEWRCKMLISLIDEATYVMRLNDHSRLEIKELFDSFAQEKLLQSIKITSNQRNHCFVK